MKICWDNLDTISLTDNGNFRRKNDLYVEEDSCVYCGEPYLRFKYRKQINCSKSCGKMEHVVSKEAKAKIGETRKLRGVSLGKNNPMYGKKHSKETIQKISNTLSGKYSGKNSCHYGKSLSDEVKAKISQSKKGNGMGNENPNWKGGISIEPYCDAWVDKDYKNSIKKRDGNVCLNPYCECIVIRKLDIHHINYNKKDCSPNNLITLCTSCNARANKDRDWHEAWYGAIINKRYRRV